MPVPHDLKIEQDDHNAILSWNDADSGDANKDPKLPGYRVVWGPATKPTLNVTITDHRVLQLQPLENGQPYVATVQSVDSYGNLSGLSAPISFTGNSSRVDALRKQMTGFFDDFNTAAGAPDELKWNQAYSACNDPAFNSMFVNNQYHVHNSVSAKNCDRSQSISRARSTFDFTGRTGIISFDFDGAQRRDQWYLDLVPDMLDITGQVSLFGNDNFAPRNYLRFHQNGQDINIIWVDASGIERSIGTADGTTATMPMWRGNDLIPNVRRHWRIEVSQTKATVYVNGHAVTTAPLSMPYSKASLLWNTLSYNTSKSNEPYVTVHWDNFGFDGPASSTDTHNYRVDGFGNDFKSLSASAATYTLNIPDSIAGAKAVRLHYTLQMGKDSWYRYDPSDNVVVNGQKLTMLEGKGWNGDAVTSINPYSIVQSLPVSAFKTGANTITFSCQSCGVLNIHAEFDFAKGTAPAYTQPGELPLPSDAGTVGPAATFVKIGAQEIAIHGNIDEADAKKVYSVGGSVPVVIAANGEIELNATGKNTGIVRVEMFLDRKTIWRQDIKNAPSLKLTYDLDTLRIPNGRHELFFVAYGSSGQASIPDYFEGHTYSGQYWPMLIDVYNQPELFKGTFSVLEGAPLAVTTPPATETSAASVSPTTNATPTAQSAITGAALRQRIKEALPFAALVGVALYFVIGALVGDRLRRKRRAASLSLLTILLWPFIAIWPRRITRR